MIWFLLAVHIRSSFSGWELVLYDTHGKCLLKLNLCNQLLCIFSFTNAFRTIRQYSTDATYSIYLKDKLISFMLKHSTHLTKHTTSTQCSIHRFTVICYNRQFPLLDYVHFLPNISFPTYKISWAENLKKKRYTYTHRKYIIVYCSQNCFYD